MTYMCKSPSSLSEESSANLERCDLNCAWVVMVLDTDCKARAVSEEYIPVFTGQKAALCLKYFLVIFCIHGGHRTAANPLMPPSPNSFLWLKRGRRCLQFPSLAPTRGSVPVKIWDIGGLSLWCFHFGDFFFKAVRTLWECSQRTSGVHTTSIWREGSRGTFWHVAAGKNTGVILWQRW